MITGLVVFAAAAPEAAMAGSRHKTKPHIGVHIGLGSVYHPGYRSRGHRYGHYRPHRRYTWPYRPPIYRYPYYRGHVGYYVPPRPVVVVRPPVTLAQPIPSVAERRTCREYQTTVIIDGREQRAYGTACLMPDGSWQRAE